MSLGSIYCQNPIVNLASNYYDPAQILPLQFLSTTPGGYSGQPATGAQNIISDASGQIKFYIVNQNIYDRTGALIDEMTYS